MPEKMLDTRSPKETLVELLYEAVHLRATSADLRARRKLLIGEYKDVLIFDMPYAKDERLKR